MVLTSPLKWSWRLTFSSIYQLKHGKVGWKEGHQTPPHLCHVFLSFFLQVGADATIQRTHIASSNAKTMYYESIKATSINTLIALWSSSSRWGSLSNPFTDAAGSLTYSRMIIMQTELVIIVYMHRLAWESSLFQSDRSSFVETLDHAQVCSDYGFHHVASIHSHCIWMRIMNHFWAPVMAPSMAIWGLAFWWDNLREQTNQY